VFLVQILIAGNHLNQRRRKQ